MIKWKSTTIHHEARLALGLSNDEYCLLDWIYHTQGNEVYGKEGWCEIPYQDIANLIGISKGGAFQMVDRMEKRGFIEVNPINTKRKRVTAKFSLPVYFCVKQDDEVGATIVQKVNDAKPSVQKVNDDRSESERNRSESERQIKVNKDKIEIKNSLSNAHEEKVEEENEAQPVQLPIHHWGDNSEGRFKTALNTLDEYFHATPNRWHEIANAAKNRLTEEQFHEEKDLWLRRYADDWQITQNPVKALTSGRGSFISWLSQTWCREKYLKQQQQQYEATNSSTRNGRVQQRGADKALPTSEELRRKYGVL